MTPPNLGKWADGDPLASGAQLRSAGYIGALVYGGTPGRAKSTTTAQRADFQSAGLQVAAVYENTSTDINGGTAAGSSHADALMSDLRNCGYPSTTPICVAADEHLTASQITLGVQYQTGFYQRAKAQGWAGPAGGYGFSEFTQAIHSANVADWLWQAGSQSALWPSVTFWQDNTGTDTVAGHATDRDWQLLPLGAPVTTPAVPWVASYPVGMPEGQFLLNQANVGAKLSADGQTVSVTINPGGTPDGQGLWTANSYVRIAMIVQLLFPALMTQIAAIEGSLSAEQTALLAAISTSGSPTDVQMATLTAALEAALPTYTVSIAPKTS